MAEKIKNSFEDLFTLIQDALSEMVEERSPKASRWYRKRHSIRFSVPSTILKYARVDFAQGAVFGVVQSGNAGCYADKLICYLPFKLEKLGDHHYRATL